MMNFNICFYSDYAFGVYEEESFVGSVADLLAYLAEDGLTEALVAEMLADGWVFLEDAEISISVW